MAGYLSTVSDPKLRRVLSMYRPSQHNLSIETGTDRPGYQRRPAVSPLHRK